MKLGMVGVQKTQKIAKVIKSYSVLKSNTNASSGWFRLKDKPWELDSLQNNFQIYCNAQEPLASLRIKLFAYQIDRYPTLEYWQADDDVKSDYFFVAYGRWLWTKDWQDVYGVGIRTDVTIDTQTAYHPGDLKMANQYRLALQNLPDDIEWVKEKVNWLWNQALGSEPPPVITVDDKLELHEYVDLGDYM